MLRLQGFKKKRGDDFLERDIMKVRKMYNVENLTCRQVLEAVGKMKVEGLKNLNGKVYVVAGE